MGRNLAAKLAGLLRADNLLPRPFLLDVGASGGIPEHYRIFRDQLSAVGFDPLTSEVDRLNRTEKNPSIKYEAAWIGCEIYDSLFPPELRRTFKDRNPWHRSSSPRALSALKSNYAQEHYNNGQPLLYSDDRYSLDHYVSRNSITDVDMIKIDTDGHDFEVLLGAEHTLSKCGVLGVQLEVFFDGPEHPYANVFHNIDRFMRGRGFSLFDLDLARYSRGALPAQFLFNIPAQTVSGQVIWAEAIYFRDIADANHRLLSEFAETQDKVMKLCCLFDIFGLPDYAAELLLKVEHDATIDRNLCRRLLNSMAPEGESYDTFVTRFDRDPTAFHPNR